MDLPLFQDNQKRRRFTHFAGLVYTCYSHGDPDYDERQVLLRISEKLRIDEDHYFQVLSNPHMFQVRTIDSGQKRMEHLLDFFILAYKNEDFDQRDFELIHRYAIRLGYTPGQAVASMDRAIKILKQHQRTKDPLHPSKAVS